MLDVVLSNRFKKDLKLAAKRGLDLDALNAIVDQLAAELQIQLAAEFTASLGSLCRTKTVTMP